MYEPPRPRANPPYRPGSVWILFKRKKKSDILPNEFLYHLSKNKTADKCARRKFTKLQVDPQNMSR